MSGTSIRTLPASWYHDPDIFEQERNSIFTRNWLVVGREQELQQPGSYVATTIANWPVLALRGSDGDLRAFHNVCRHRASPVAEPGAGQCDLLRCPYHGWAYGLDGSLQHAPGFSQDTGFDARAMGLLPIRVAIWNGLVFVCLDPNAIELESWLGDIITIAGNYPAIADMHYARSVTNEGDVNWKSYSDNSAEGYHLGSVHRELSSSLIRDQTHIAAYENGRFIGFDVTYKGANEHDSSKGFWIYKFPGLLLHFSERGFNLERVTPLSPTSTRMERWFWFHAAADSAEIDASIEFSNRVMDEDLGICRRVQQNLEAGVYDTGLLSPEREPGTIYFQKLVRESLQAA